MALDHDIQDFCAWCRESLPDVAIDTVRDFVVGVDQRVPLVGGRDVPYVNLDNAATKPPFSSVLQCHARFIQWYASVHRGGGFKSILSTRVYEHCRDAVAEFIGADLAYHTLIFTQNTTHSLNKLATRLGAPADGAILSTMMEHHSNMLPWRMTGRPVEYVRVEAPGGRIDLADFERRLRGLAGGVALVTVTAGSNVTGILPPIRAMARLAHEAGALFAVDAAQVIAHRPFRMGAPDDPERVDFAAFSAHKVYAPFGSGVLVGPRSVFESGPPDMAGGGTVDAVTLDDIIWTAPPERDEAGTPNVPGALALASALQTLSAIGMDAVAEHERALTRRALDRLARIDRLTLYGPTDPALREDRLGVIPFNVDGMPHDLVAAALTYEWGIGVRSGCFCAQPYVRHLLGVDDGTVRRLLARRAAGERLTLPGMVRVSLGVYNTADEIDYLAEALAAIAERRSAVRYALDPQSMEYVPDTPDGPVFRRQQYVSC